MLSLCSVTTCSLQSCVATTVNYITQRRKCCLLTVPPCPPLHSTWSSVSGNRCHTSPLPHTPVDRTSVTSRHCEENAQKATPIEKWREEWAEEDQCDRRFSWSTSIRFFQLSNPLSSACRAWLFTVSVQLSSLTQTWHHCRTTCLSTPWPWRPLSLLAQRSAASPSQTAASHSPWFSLSRKHTPCLTLQCKIRRHIQEEVWHIHLHSGQ